MPRRLAKKPPRNLFGPQLRGDWPYWPWVGGLIIVGCWLVPIVAWLRGGGG